MAQLVLGTATMFRTGLVLVIVIASASAASAGGFVGLGVGTGAATSGDFNIDEDGRSGRLMVGYRFGRFSVEGMGSRYDMMSPDGHEWTASTLAVAGKYSLPLQDNFEVFGRFGLQHTGIDGNVYDEELSGNGILVSGGAEFRLPIAAAGISLWVDYSIVHSSMDSWNATELGLTSRIWTLGATVSF